MTNKVLILEDEPHTQQLLSLVVENAPNLELVSAVSSIAAVRTYLSAHPLPNVFLIDLGLPDGSGIALIRHIRELSSTAHIMVVSIFGDELNVLHAIEAGADGYIHKDESLDTIAEHIQSMLTGNTPISPSIAKYILRKIQTESQNKKNAPNTEFTLTGREVGVLQVLARGYTRHEVAEQFNLSPHTISVHIKKIYKKMSVHTRTEAIYEAYQLGIIQVND